MADAVSDEQPQTAEAVFEQTRREIKGAIALEDERRTVLVKNLYRLRALRVSRERAAVGVHQQR